MMRSPSLPRVRLAQPGDAEAIIALYRAGQRSDVCELTALGCPGAVRYVAALVAESQLGGSQQFWVAEDDNTEVVGFAQVKQLGLEICFNNTFVDPRAQRRGYATALYRAALASPDFTAPTVARNVFEDNRLSRAFGDRIGYKPIQRSVWLVGNLPHVSPAAYRVDGLPQANAVHEAFGFSTFDVITSRGRYPIGRLGTEWFRLPSPEALEDDGMLAALRRIDPTRQAFVIAADAPLGGRAAAMERLAISIRMQAARDKVLKRLEHIRDSVR